MNQHDFNRLLIDFVREEEVLYQSQNLNFTNSGERHLAYERIAAKLQQHGASYDQTHRLNEKFLKLKWRYMKEYHQVEGGKRDPTWPYYESLTFLLPSILDLERKRMNASVPEDNHSREEQYVDVQACDVMPSPSTSAGPKRTAQKRSKAMMYEETDNRLMEKRRVTNMAFAEFVARKLDEMPEPIRSQTERQIIDLVMSIHVETYEEISHSAAIQPLHANERDLPIAADIYHPANAPDAPLFENCAPPPQMQAAPAPSAVPTNVPRPRARAVRKPKGGEQVGH